MIADVYHNRQKMEILLSSEERNGDLRRNGREERFAHDQSQPALMGAIMPHQNILLL